MAWEYKQIVSSGKPADEADLNGLGADNWELVGFQVAHEGVEFGEPIYAYLFKREKKMAGAVPKGFRGGSIKS